MGITCSLPFSFSSIWSNSYLKYTNDFELVCRATKDLEHMLVNNFGAPDNKQVGLHDKISHVEKSANLSKETVKKLRYLVTVRNKLVHDVNFNKLPDRKDFARSFDSVEKELKQKLKEIHGESSCVIC